MIVLVGCVLHKCVFNNTEHGATALIVRLVPCRTHLHQNNRNKCSGRLNKKRFKRRGVSVKLKSRGFRYPNYYRQNRVMGAKRGQVAQTRTVRFLSCSNFFKLSLSPTLNYTTTATGTVKKSIVKIGVWTIDFLFYCF